MAEDSAPPYIRVKTISPVLSSLTADETVAIKVIELKSLKDQVTKDLLQTELECIKKINHPNLLKYIDSYETINNCYIVT